MRRWVPVVLVVLAAPAAAPAGHATEGAKRCKRVAFTPQSDDLAAGIRARGVSCRYARRFVRQTRGRPPAVHRGWLCASTLVDGEDHAGLTYTLVRCERSGDRMRWKKF